MDLKHLKNRVIWDLEAKRTVFLSKDARLVKKWLAKILKFICIITLLCGIFCALNVLFGGFIDGRTAGPLVLMVSRLFGTIGIFISQFALFLSIIFLSTTIILLKLTDKKRHPRYYKVFGMTGLITSGILLLPLMLTPVSVLGAEINFANAFGTDWRSHINPAVEAKYFMTTPFSLPGYFLSIPKKECNYQSDVLYFNGTLSDYSVDENVTLYFDVYWPKTFDADMPGVRDGKYSILIRIHGGGWMRGDKGTFNVMQMNHYFAAQGYVVYDIQYGLGTWAYESNPPESIPAHVVGNFTMNDIVRHIANFTRYITDDSKLYSAADINGNLDSVFFSGGSARGQLATVSALLIANKTHSEYVDSKLNVSGYVPFYPGNGVVTSLKIGGDEELKNPIYLVEKDSPPCLIYHGTSDGLTSPLIAREFKNAYDAVNNKECAILWALMSGHGADSYFQGYYNQVFLYYMERFMYLCVNGFIV